MSEQNHNESNIGEAERAAPEPARPSGVTYTIYTEEQATLSRLDLEVTRDQQGDIVCTVKGWL